MSLWGEDVHDIYQNLSNVFVDLRVEECNYSGVSVEKIDMFHKMSNRRACNTDKHFLCLLHFFSKYKKIERWLHS